MNIVSSYGVEIKHMQKHLRLTADIFRKAAAFLISVSSGGLAWSLNPCPDEGASGGSKACRVTIKRKTILDPCCGSRMF